MPFPRGQSSVQRPPGPAAPLRPRRRWPAVWAAVIVITVSAVAAMEHTAHGRSIVSSVREFLLTYAGVFALVGLTAAVGVGLAATDRIVMRPGGRVVAQSVHRGVSLGALAALAVHVALEVTAHKAGVLDVIIPFVSHYRTLYTGLGTVAADLFVLIIVTGFLRGRFAGKWPWAWRSIHAAAYAAWPLAVLHGLLGGRAAKPYVDWSYGGLLGLAGLALAVRYAATVRSSREKLPHPVPDRLSGPAEGLIPGTRVSMAPLGAPAGGAGNPLTARRALPAAATGMAGITGATGTGVTAGVTGAAGITGTAETAGVTRTAGTAEAAEAGAAGAAGGRPRAQPPIPPDQLAQARHSQAQQLQTQQRQARQRKEQLLRPAVPAPGRAPGQPGRAAEPGWRTDPRGWPAVDTTDPRGWPAVDATDPRGRPAKHSTDPRGWPVPGAAGRRSRAAAAGAADPLNGVPGNEVPVDTTDPRGWPATDPAGRRGWAAARPAIPGDWAAADPADALDWAAAAPASPPDWAGADGEGWPAPDPGDVYGWPDARDLTDAHGWTDTVGPAGGPR